VPVADDETRPDGVVLPLSEQHGLAAFGIDALADERDQPLGAAEDALAILVEPPPWMCLSFVRQIRCPLLTKKKPDEPPPGHSLPAQARV
jgi:hypothetical protein